MKTLHVEALTSDERSLILSLVRQHVERQEKDTAPNSGWLTQFAWGLERKLLKGDHLAVVGVK